MPEGMILRSDYDWHLDPYEKHTIHAYLDSLNLKPSDVDPLSLQFYLDYTDWFQRQKRIKVKNCLVVQLDGIQNGDFRFMAKMDNGETIKAKNVVMALGFVYFKHYPEKIHEMIPNGRLSHTCDLIDFKSLRNKRCLVIGGRQSAFEWAAMIREIGAEQIHIVYRHETPSFVLSD